MSKEIYISSTPQETRLAIVEKDELSEIYYERENEYTLAGSIYNGRVTRVLPGMQSAFVDVGLERDAFLYITDFLEEEGESADFEAGGGGERGAEKQRNGGGNRERGGDRERNGDRDRNSRPREEGRREAAPVRTERPAETAETTDEPIAPASEGSAEAGDETGAGSRRWRGRRGRRRGGEARGAGAPETAGSDTAEGSAEAPREYGEPQGEVQGEAQGEAQIGGIEAAAPSAASAEDRLRESRGREERPREERGRDRGGRGRDGSGRGRERSGDRERTPAAPEETGDVHLDAAAAEPFILPGESLSKYKRNEDGSPAASASVTSKAQPSYLTAKPSTEFSFSAAGWDGGSVLPGETLSRKRRDDAPRTAAPVASAGEAGSERQTVETAEIASDADAQAASGRDRRRDRDKRRGRDGRGDGGRQPASQNTLAQSSAEGTTEEPTPTSFYSGVVSREVLEPMQAVQPGVTSQHEPEGTSLPFADAAQRAEARPDLSVFEEGAYEAGQSAGEMPREDVPYEPETDSVAGFRNGPSDALLEAVQEAHETVAASSAPATVLELEEFHEEFHEETTEYEPGEDASASYRVDPVGPSEFRQSSLIADNLDLTAVRFEEGSEIAEEGSTHEFTSLQSTGEMLSELPGEVAVPGAEEDPTNPIEHETAVQSTYLGDVTDMREVAQPAEAGAPTNFAQPQGGSSNTPQVFAPGDGQLEEELLDEDETDALDLAASYGDDTEEETFEAGAEIGSLARDRALDQITSGDAALADEDEDDEDDFDIDEEEMEENDLDESEQIAGSDVSELEEDEFSESDANGFDDEGEKPAAAAMGEFPEFTEAAPEGGSAREPRRERSEGRTEGGREPRRGDGRDRGGRGGRDNRDRRGMANSRSNGGGRPSRHSMQNTDLPAISDLLKPGQEVLVQIAKEPIAKKGARITSHIALPGRFLVFMPTVNHVGVSRKIESDGERRRLKEVLLSEKGEAAGGFIVRTAASGASEEELRSDLRFLLNLWADIKQRSEASKSPALIYHDLNLVERVLRDQVGDNFSAIWVDTETEYERVLRFLQRFQPSLMRRVKLYTKDTPLFEQFGISEEINKALRSKVWLKSGGSIVINQTEALVAIDINTGKFVGKTARLEDTIVKTNLDAIPEIVRQIRLRDLGGIIVIDFIDMDDRKNRAKVLAALEEELKNDRAPSKVLQFNDFGLVAITRKRVKQSLERTLSTTCGICAGTGMTKSPVTVCNEIWVELRKMHKQLDKGDVMLRVNPEVVKQLKSNNGKWLQEMEEISGKTILVKSDPSLHPEQFDIH